MKQVEQVDEEYIIKEEVEDGFSAQIMEKLDIKYENHNYELISGISPVIKSSSNQFSSSSLLQSKSYSQSQQQQKHQWVNISSKNFSQHQTSSSVQNPAEVVTKKETFKLISGSHDLNNAILPSLSTTKIKMGGVLGRPKLVYESRRNCYYNPVITTSEETNDVKRKVGRPRKSESNNNINIVVVPPPPPPPTPPILENDKKRKVERPRKYDDYKIVDPPTRKLEEEENSVIANKSEHHVSRMLTAEELIQKRKVGRPRKSESDKVRKVGRPPRKSQSVKMGKTEPPPKFDEGGDNTFVDDSPNHHQEKSVKRGQVGSRPKWKEENNKLMEESKNLYQAAQTIIMNEEISRKRKIVRPRKYSNGEEIEQPPKLDKEVHNTDFMSEGQDDHHPPKLTEEIQTRRKVGRPRKSDQLIDFGPPQLTLEVVVDERQNYHHETMMMTEPETVKRRKVGPPQKYNDYKIIGTSRKSEEEKETVLIDEKQKPDKSPAAAATTTTGIMTMTEEMSKKRKVGRPQKSGSAIKTNKIRPPPNLHNGDNAFLDESPKNPPAEMTEEMIKKRKAGRPRKSDNEKIMKVKPSPQTLETDGHAQLVHHSQNYDNAAAEKTGGGVIEKRKVGRPRIFNHYKNIIGQAKKVMEAKNTVLLTNDSYQHAAATTMTEGVNVKRKVGRPRKSDKVRKVGRPQKSDKVNIVGRSSFTSAQGRNTTNEVQQRKQSYFYRAMMASQELRKKRMVSRPRKYDDYKIAGMSKSKEVERADDGANLGDESKNVDPAPKTILVNKKPGPGRSSKLHKRRLPAAEKPVQYSIARRCPICGEFRTNLDTHVSTVHRMKIYFCNLCPEHFSGKLKLKEHKVEAHQMMRPIRYPCEYCDEKFTLKTLLTKHIKIRHWFKPKFRCTLCPKTFVKLANLQAHWQGVGNPCSTCGAVIRKKTKSTVVQKVTDSPKSFYCCPVCLAPFQDDYDMTQHLKDEHAGTGFASRLYTCPLPECTETFTHISTWRAHLFEERRKIPCHCEACPNLIFPNFKAFKLHILEEHPESIEKSSRSNDSSSKTSTFLQSVCAENNSSSCALCAECQVRVLQIATMPDREYEKYLDSVASTSTYGGPMDVQGVEEGGHMIDNNYYDNDQLFEDVSMENIDMNDIDVTVEVLN